MNFLKLKDRSFLITGVANKKSVAFHVAKTLEESGAEVFLSVQNEANYEKVSKLFPNNRIFICDVEDSESIEKLRGQLEGKVLSGFLHSIAFANYSEGIKPFHETKVKDYLQATNISCFSLVSQMCLVFLFRVLSDFDLPCYFCSTSKLCTHDKN